MHPSRRRGRADTHQEDKTAQLKVGSSDMRVFRLMMGQYVERAGLGTHTTVCHPKGGQF